MYAHKFADEVLLDFQPFVERAGKAHDEVIHFVVAGHAGQARVGGGGDALACAAAASEAEAAGLDWVMLCLLGCVGAGCALAGVLGGFGGAVRGAFWGVF